MTRPRVLFRGIHLLALAGLLSAAGSAGAAALRVAVAANFADTLRVLGARFQADTDHKVVVIAGSTGKLYAQVVHGAPFDLFFAADERRPRLLEKAGEIVPGSRESYASGRLALWIPEHTAPDDVAAWLRGDSFSRLAIASPKLAPYGRAARQVLEGFDVWKSLGAKLVRGESIAQAYQFVASGAAPAGFVALSQLRKPGNQPDGFLWIVPEEFHDPVDQQLVLLRDSAAARSFLSFVRGATGRGLIEAYGYRVGAEKAGPP